MGEGAGAVRKGSIASRKLGQTDADGYSTREVAGLIGLKPDQVRHYVRRKVLAPGRDSKGHYRYGFQDIVLLRTVKGLLDAEVSAREVHRALTKLKAQLKATNVQSLTGMRIFADGRQVVVSSDRQIFNVATGQGHLDFAVRELADNVAELANNHVSSAVDTEAMSSDEWYNLGLDLEAVDSAKAPECYRRALSLDPRNADAHVNLGRLYQLKRDLKYAKRHYDLALAVAREHQLARYNLGTIFDELGDLGLAKLHYRMAPDVADAHYNLARIMNLQGDEVSSLRHMRRYQQLTGEAPPPTGES